MKLLLNKTWIEYEISMKCFEFSNNDTTTFQFSDNVVCTQSSVKKMIDKK